MTTRNLTAVQPQYSTHLVLVVRTGSKERNDPWFKVVAQDLPEGEFDPRKVDVGRSVVEFIALGLHTARFTGNDGKPRMLFQRQPDRLSKLHVVEPGFHFLSVRSVEHLGDPFSSLEMIEILDQDEHRRYFGHESVIAWPRPA